MSLQKFLLFLICLNIKSGFLRRKKRRAPKGRRVLTRAEPKTNGSRSPIKREKEKSAFFIRNVDVYRVYPTTFFIQTLD